jgi:hypothetical protein
MDKPKKQSKKIADLYPLSPLQAGMVFHSLTDPGSGVYVEQFAVEIDGTFDPAAFTAAWSGRVCRIRSRSSTTVHGYR